MRHDRAREPELKALFSAPSGLTSHWSRRPIGLRSYLAQADVFVTLDTELARSVEGIVASASIDSLR
jgi:hypothetical protein